MKFFNGNASFVVLFVLVFFILYFSIWEIRFILKEWISFNGKNTIVNIITYWMKLRRMFFLFFWYSSNKEVVLGKFINVQNGQVQINWLFLNLWVLHTKKRTYYGLMIFVLIVFVYIFSVDCKGYYSLNYFQPKSDKTVLFQINFNRMMRLFKIGLKQAQSNRFTNSII